jgi:hypothetical protein
MKKISKLYLHHPCVSLKIISVIVMFFFARKIKLLYGGFLEKKGITLIFALKHTGMGISKPV